MARRLSYADAANAYADALDRLGYLLDIAIGAGRQLGIQDDQPVQMSLINTRDVLNSEATNRGPASTTHLNILTGRSEELGSPLPQPEGAIFPVSNNDNHSNNNRNEKVQGLGESTSSAQQNAANSSLAIKSERLSQDHEEEDEDGYVPGGIRPARRWCQTCLRTMKGPCRNKRSMASSACINCMYNCHNRDCEEVPADLIPTIIERMKEAVQVISSNDQVRIVELRRFFRGALDGAKKKQANRKSQVYA